jgi:hypothetical protein
MADDNAPRDLGDFREVMEARDRSAQFVVELAASTNADDDAAAGDDRPSWLPANFHTPEDLAKSYGEAQRLITKQGTENRDLREQNAQLAELIAQYEAMVPPVGLPEPEETYGWDEPDTFVPQPQPRTMDQLVQQAVGNPAAQQAVAAAVDSPAMQAIAQNALASALNQEQESAVVAEGWAKAIGAVPEIAGKTSEIAAMLHNDPSMEAAVRAGSPLAVAGAIGEAYKVLASQEALPALRHQMKLQAQTASGATGRPAPAGPDRWNEIKNATGGKLDFS